MAETDNPAGRLYELLKASKARDNRELIRQVWSELLKVGDPSSTPTLVHRIAQVIELPDQIRLELAHIEMDTSTWEEHLPEVDRALPNLLALDSSVQHINQTISEAMLVNLQGCSSILHGFRAERTLTEVELQDFRQQIESLLEDAIELDVDTELRAFLVDHLHDILRAIDTYHVAGLDALRRSFERTVGGLVRDPSMKERAEPKKSMWDKFGRLMAGIGVVLATANQGTELVGHWWPELMPSQNDKPPVVVVVDAPPSPGAPVVVNDPSSAQPDPP